jgi:uncharacterized protein with ATP-grasp and redox domains
MTLKELLEKTSYFQKVAVFYGYQSRCETAMCLLENIGESWLDRPVLEIKAEDYELSIVVGD